MSTVLLITSYVGQTNRSIKMSSDSSPNRQTTAVAGGSSAKPTPANNVGGGEGWGDRLWLGGKEEGLGHAAVRVLVLPVHRHSIRQFGLILISQATNPRSTMGDFLALQDQKTRGQNKFIQRENLVDSNVKPINAEGEPTCATEDHSFMTRKAGDPDTYPGWGTFKNFFGM